MRLANLLCFTATAAVLTSPAFAQTEPEDIITVYDNIRRVQDLPLSADVLTASELSTLAAVHPAEAINQISGVHIHRGSGQEHLTAIRSPVLTGGAGAGSFLYLEDGVPLRAAGFANVNGLFEGGTEFAQSLEIIKGPGPATYGSNAVHGLINIRAQNVGAPSRISVMGSEDGYVSLRASHDLSSTLRASLSLAHDDGFRDDSGFDQQKAQVKYESEIGDVWSVDWLTSFQNLNQETVGFIQGPDAYKDDAIRFTNPNPEAFRDAKSYRTQARFERNVSDYTLAITPYARRSELRFLRHFVPGQALEKNAHNSAGVQTAFFDPGGDFNIGVDAEYTKGSVYEFQENPNRFSFIQGLHYDYDVDAIVLAGYGQKRIDISPKTRLDVGLRGEYTHYDYDNQASTGQFGRFIRSADRKDGFFTVTPKASLTHKATDALNLYIRAARGSRAPQVTDLYSAQLNQVPGEAKIETLDNLEAGFKYKTDNLSLSAAAFSMWKDNFFFRNANGFNVVNGKTEHRGVEAEFDAALSGWFSLSGSLTAARHSYAFTEITGSAANNILDGNRVDTAPDTLAHLRATFAPTQALSANLEWRHVGKYFTNPGNTARYPGQDIFVMRASYNISGAAQIYGHVDNLFDAKYADRADFAFGNERYFPGRPRTLFLGLSYTY